MSRRRYATDRGLSSIMEARTSKVHIKETRDHLMAATRTDEVFCDFRAASLASSKRLPQCEKSCSHPTIANHRGRVSYRRGRRASFRTAWVLPFCGAKIGSFDDVCNER